MEMEDRQAAPVLRDIGNRVACRDHPVDLHGHAQSAGMDRGKDCGARNKLAILTRIVLANGIFIMIRYPIVRA